MDLSRPARCVSPSLHADVLLVLSGTTRSLTGRQVHRLIPGAASQSGVQRALGQLVKSGLVHLTEAGSAHLYALNRDHVAAESALALTDLRGRLFQRIHSAVSAWPIPPLGVAVFGSAARGDGNEDSDIDLFLIRPPAVAPDDTDWTQQVAELNASIWRWSGNAGSVVEASPQQIGEMVARQEPVIAELARDQVLLLGMSVLDVVGVSR